MSLTGIVLDSKRAELSLFPKGTDQRPPSFAVQTGVFNRLWTIFSGEGIRSSIQTGAVTTPVVFDVQHIAKTLGIAANAIPRKTEDFERFLHEQALCRNIQQLKRAIPDLSAVELDLIKQWIRDPNIEPVIPKDSIIDRLRMEAGRPILQLLQWGIYPLTSVRRWDLSRSVFDDLSSPFLGAAFYFELPAFIPLPEMNVFELSSKDVANIRRIVSLSYSVIRQTKSNQQLEVSSQLPCEVGVDRSGEVVLQWKSYHLIEKTVRIFHTTLKCLARTSEREELLKGECRKKKFEDFLVNGPSSIYQQRFQMFMALFKIDAQSSKEIFDWINQHYRGCGEQTCELEGVRIHLDADGEVSLRILRPPTEPRSLAELAAKPISFLSLPPIFPALLQEAGVELVKAREISSRLCENYHEWLATARALNGWFSERGVLIHSSGDVYIKQKGGVGFANGNTKKVKEAIDLSSAIRWKRLVAAPDAYGLENEIEILWKVVGLRGLAQIREVIRHQNRKGSWRIALILENYRLMSLMPYLKNGVSFTPSQQDQLIDDLVCGLVNLHQLGYVHCDLNLNNVFFDTTEAKTVWKVTLTPQSSLRAFIGDFNLAQPFGGKTPIIVCGNQAVCSPQKARLWLEAYQLQDKSNVFRTDKEALEDDIWALGAILYSIRQNGVLPWEQIMDEKDLLRRLAAFDREEYPPNVMESFYPAPEDKDSIAFLTYQMLQFDPDKRPLTLEVFARLQQIRGDAL